MIFAITKVRSVIQQPITAPLTTSCIVCFLRNNRDQLTTKGIQQITANASGPYKIPYVTTKAVDTAACVLAFMNLFAKSKIMSERMIPNATIERGKKIPLKKTAIPKYTIEKNSIIV